MRKIIILFLLASSFAFGQTALPYYTGFNTVAEIDGWEEFSLGATESFYYWSTSNSSLSHDYPVGGTIPTDDWWVSPEFDFSNGALIDSLKFKFSGFGNPTAGDTIALYLINGAKNPINASNIILLREYTDANYQNDNIWRLDTAITIPAIVGGSYIGFRYYTTDNWLVSSFDDLYVSSSTVGVGETVISFNLIPNPTTDILKIEGQEKGLVEVYNVLGEKVLVGNKFEDEKRIDVSNLKQGVYFLNLNGNTSRFVKQ